MRWVLYHYHRLMSRIYKREGAWQSGSFIFHRNKMKKYERSE